MTEHPDDNDVETDRVVAATDARIRKEALRQLAAFDLEDDHARMPSLVQLIASHPKRSSSASSR